MNNQPVFCFILLQLVSNIRTICITISWTRRAKSSWRLSTANWRFLQTELTTSWKICLMATKCWVRIYLNLALSFVADGLFNFLGEQMNKILDENWKEVGAELNPALSEIVNSIITRVTKNIVTKVPFKDLFLESWRGRV